MSPLSDADTENIFSKLRGMTSSVIMGSLVVAVAQGVISGAGYYLFGLPNPVLWGFASVITALVPVVGAMIIIAPAIVYFIFYSNTAVVAGFTLWVFVMVALTENILRPRLIGRNVEVHPLLVLLSVLGGLAQFGAMGFLLGPLALSFLLALLEIYPSLILKRTGESV
jgi:predicted PurR-regulated permease PerM